MTGLARRRRHISSTWLRADSSSGASMTSRMILPMATSLTLVYPRAGRARSTVAPCGSAMPGRWLTSIRASYLTTRSYRLRSRIRRVPFVEAFARDALVGLDVPNAGAVDHGRRQRRRGRRLVPADLEVVVADELLVERGR